MTLLFVLLSLLWLSYASVLQREANIRLYEREPLQDLVAWDQHSLLVRGERVMFFSGEFHPFRLPVPGLWLDIFQKIKAMGFSGVSFYTNWGLLEGNPGHVVTDGIFSLDEFFRAATEAGIYLLARPGPYINAETASGGMPGWTLRLKGILRSNDSDYLNATQNYISTIGKKIADAQITNGGPVIMVQPENEYSTWPGVTNFPNAMNREYMAFVEQQLRDSGIIVPYMVNDNENLGNFAPGSGLGAVDLYGIDAYPLRYDCGNPYVWPTYRFPRDWQDTHQLYSSATPFAIAEFQSGSGGGWGGVTEDGCAILVNNEAVRVMYKNNYSFGVTIFNSYMIYGGTNWGNLGYHGGYTSYDYGAAITEDRLIWREKYSEMKLEANFLKVSPAYLTATPGNAVNGSYGTTDEISVTPLFGNGTSTNFYIVRHADFTSTLNTSYILNLTTTGGIITIPQLGGTLSLNGRDSKIHVTDYDVGGYNLVYSSAEIFTWAKSSGSSRVLILYGGAGETHEVAFLAAFGTPMITEGSGVAMKEVGLTWVLNWQVSPTRKVVTIGDLQIYLVWRNEVYNYWVMELEAPGPIGNFTSLSKSTAIIKAGYLLRSATIVGDELRLTGDVNTTTAIEVISLPTQNIRKLSFNGKYQHVENSQGRLTATVNYQIPNITIPNLVHAQWKYADSLPEVYPNYDDSLWQLLNNPTSNNPRSLTTPTSLYASDYGYHTGSLIYRGLFVSNGNESTFFVNATGGYGFGHSIWINETFLGSWIGSGSNQTYAQTFDLPIPLASGSAYVLTILIDHMGQDEEAPGTDAIKFPRGILDYSLSSRAQSSVVWKMTGNLGGEQYRDLARGPRNEGAMFAERQGYHLPRPPSHDWKISNPIKDGIEGAGVRFYVTSFELDIPKGYDIPMSFVFNATNATNSTNATNTGSNYRCQLFVNGYQFGKYVNNIGPQTTFPIPEGILNYHGRNDIGITLWALDKNGARLSDFSILPHLPILSGYQKPVLAPQPSWTVREGAY